MPRPILRQAVRLADPANEFAALRAAPAGSAIAAAWQDRSAALAAYARHLPRDPEAAPADTAGIDANAVLDALLHCHFLRAVGIDPADKARCLYLARAAAQATIARTGGRP